MSKRFPTWIENRFLAKKGNSLDSLKDEKEVCILCIANITHPPLRNQGAGEYINNIRFLGLETGIQLQRHKHFKGRLAR